MLFLGPLFCGGAFRNVGPECFERMPVPRCPFESASPDITLVSRALPTPAAALLELELLDEDDDDDDDPACAAGAYAHQA